MLKIRVYAAAILCIAWLGDGVCMAEVSAKPSPHDQSVSSSNQAPSVGTPSEPVEREKAKPKESSAMDYLFSNRPAQGSAAGEVFEAQDGAKTKIMAQDALGFERIEDHGMRARFQEYLGIAATPESRLRDYQDEFNRTLQLLREGKAVDAWKHLLVLAEYREIDAGVSWELANRIESIWNADRTTALLASRNEEMRKEIGQATRNADYLSDRIREEDLEYQRRSKQGRQKEQSNLPNGGAPAYDPNGGGRRFAHGAKRDGKIGVDRNVPALLGTESSDQNERDQVRKTL